MKSYKAYLNESRLVDFNERIKHHKEHEDWHDKESDDAELASTYRSGYGRQAESTLQPHVDAMIAHRLAKEAYHNAVEDRKNGYDLTAKSHAKIAKYLGNHADRLTNKLSG